MTITVDQTEQAELRHGGRRECRGRLGPNHLLEQLPVCQCGIHVRLEFEIAPVVQHDPHDSGGDDQDHDETQQLQRPGRTHHGLGTDDSERHDYEDEGRGLPRFFVMLEQDEVSAGPYEPESDQSQHQAPHGSER